MGRHKTISDEEVINAAREVFLRDGTAASTREIGKRAGLSQAALFQRFGDKTELFTRAMVPEPLDPAVVIGPPDEAARLGSGEHIENVAIRLVEQIATVLPVLMLVGQHPGLRREVIDGAHSRVGVQKLITALESHMAGLDLTPGHSPAELVNALVLIAHGAALMKLGASPEAAAHAEQPLRRAVRSLLGRSGTREQG